MVFDDFEKMRTGRMTATLPMTALYFHRQSLDEISQSELIANKLFV